MKNKHRNVKLDQFIGQTVRVKFIDNSFTDGVLIWNETINLNKNFNHVGYYLVMANYNLFFQKSDVKHIERIY